MSAVPGALISLEPTQFMCGMKLDEKTLPAPCFKHKLVHFQDTSWGIHRSSLVNGLVEDNPFLRALTQALTLRVKNKTPGSE
jgi:hypothetical protein